MSWEHAVRSLIDDPEQAEFGRQCYFDLPLLGAAERFHASDEWASVRSRFPGRPGRALDVGAGNGIVSYALGRDGWDVTAVEPDPSALVGAAAVRALATESGIPITVVEGVAEDLEVAEGHYDAIFVRQVFHHAPDIEAFARRLAYLLKPGGLVLTWRDHVVSTVDELPAFFDRHPLHHKYGGENAFTAEQYRHALEGAGLTIEEQLRHFDDPMNYGPASAREIFTAQASHKLPMAIAKPIGALLGSKAVFGIIAPALSALDHRPGRHIAFLARKPV